MSTEDIRDQVLKAIRSGKTRFSDIWSACNAVGPVPGIGRGKLDDELQKLRKAGTIEYISKTGWRITGK